MKKCTKCETEKELTDFWVRKDRGSGANTICKNCLNNDRKKRNLKNKDKINQQQKEQYQKNREKRLEWMAEYWQRLPQERKDEIRERKRLKFKNSEAQKKNKLEYLTQRYDKQKFQCNKDVAEALRKGKLIKPENCQICNEKKKLDGHHSDYSKPLEVIWVCRKCHFWIHKSLKE